MKYFATLCLFVSSFGFAQTPCGEYSQKVDTIVQSEPHIQFKTKYDSNLVATLLREGSAPKEVINKTVRDFKKSTVSLDSVQTYLTLMRSCIFAKYRLALAMLHEAATNKIAMNDFKTYLKTENIEPTGVHIALMYALLEKYECQHGKSELCKEATALTVMVRNRLSEGSAHVKPIWDKINVQDNTKTSLEKKDIEVLHKSILEDIDFAQGQIRKIEALTKKL